MLARYRSPCPETFLKNPLASQQNVLWGQCQHDATASTASRSIDESLSRHSTVASPEDVSLSTASSSTSEKTLSKLVNEQCGRLKQAQAHHDEVLRRVALLRIRRQQLLQAVSRAEKQQEAARERHRLALERRRLWDEKRQQTMVAAKQRTAAFRERLRAGSLASQRDAADRRSALAMQLRCESQESAWRVKEAAQQDLQWRQALRNNVIQERERQRAFIQLQHIRRIYATRAATGHRFREDQTRLQSVLKKIHDAETLESNLMEELRQLQVGPSVSKKSYILQGALKTALQHAAHHPA